ncbi:MAG TPA: class I SAM-dependent methyltransferase [Candidatus Binatia bacterium]|jgi:ubiquinone/menaquinone biosynthesis C-methylase UbiE
MSSAFSVEGIAAKYDRVARWYDWIEGIPDLLGLRKLRRRLLERASGRVLEIAVGTGKNLEFYPRGSQVVALDLSREMLNVAQNRALKLPIQVSFLVADTEALPFAPQSCDTIVSTLSSCTFPNPVTAFREMARVSKPSGRILLLEHGRSNRERLGRFQDRHAEQFAKPLGCHWNREPQQLVQEAGLKILDAQRFFFGILHVIQATPKEIPHN